VSAGSIAALDSLCGGPLARSDACLDPHRERPHTEKRHVVTYRLFAINVTGAD
jgi:hypothetical protein